MTLHTTITLLRVGSAKTLTRSATEGDIKEGLGAVQYFV